MLCSKLSSTRLFVLSASSSSRTKGTVPGTGEGGVLGGGGGDGGLVLIILFIPQFFIFRKNGYRVFFARGESLSSRKMSSSSRTSGMANSGVMNGGPASTPPCIRMQNSPMRTSLLVEVTVEIDMALLSESVED